LTGAARLMEAIPLAGRKIRKSAQLTPFTGRREKRFLVNYQYSSAKPVQFPTHLR
jgi:hypothetical protein